jgi:arylsulfatase
MQKPLINVSSVPLALIFLYSVSFGLVLSIILELIGLSSFEPSTIKKQSVLAQTTGSTEDQRPNILLITGDDFGWSDIGAFGAEISTPNLDQLAKEGRIGMNYHTAPTCSPARAGLLTGVDWHLAGLGNMY